MMCCLNTLFNNYYAQRLRTFINCRLYNQREKSIIKRPGVISAWQLAPQRVGFSL